MDYDSRPTYNLPCQKCGSSDALVDYGVRTHCYSCNATVFAKDSIVKVTTPKRDKAMDMIAGGEYADIKGTDEFVNRGIIKDAAERYGVKVIKDSNGEVQKVVFPYSGKDGNYVAQKVRVKGYKGKGVWHGNVSATNTFFGQRLFHKGKTLIVTEGEYDAVAAYQMFGQRYPVVSLRNGADKSGSGPVKEFKDNFEYFRNFENIVLCFDNDEPGQISAREVAKQFPPNKCKIMSMHQFKDANEYLLNGADEEFRKAFFDAKPITPQGIVYGTDLRDRIITKLKDRLASTAVKYPWEGLNNLTYGIRKEEMVTIISGSGMGKSAVIGELMHHILVTTEEKIGLMMLEESVEMANLRLASLHASKPFHIPDTDWTEEELVQMLNETVELRDSNGDPRVVSFDHFGSNGIDETLFRIDHMVALGCKFIFLDHISILVSDQQHGDERRALDEIATKLRTKVQEHGISLFIVSHLRRSGSKPHEEGGQTSLADIRGTAAIGQLSDMVIGLERNGQADDEITRNTTTLRILKNRFSGLTGEACKLFYTRETGRLVEVKGEDKTLIQTKTEEEIKNESLTLTKNDDSDEMPF